MVGPLGDFHTQKRRTFHVSGRGWVLHDLNCYFLDRATIALNQAREFFHVIERAAQTVVTLLGPLGHAFHIKLTQDVSIDRVISFEKGVS